MEREGRRAKARLWAAELDRRGAARKRRRGGQAEIRLFAMGSFAQGEKNIAATLVASHQLLSPSCCPGGCFPGRASGVEQPRRLTPERVYRVGARPQCLALRGNETGASMGSTDSNRSSFGQAKDWRCSPLSAPNSMRRASSLRRASRARTSEPNLGSQGKISDQREPRLRVASGV